MKLDDIPLIPGGEGPLGHLGDLQNDRLDLFRRLNRGCGDIGRASAVGVSMVFVNSPELLHEVLVEKARSFIKPAGVRGPLRPLAGDGLFTSEGDLWRTQRRLMAPLFAHGQVERYAACMARCARDVAAELRPGSVVDMARKTNHLAMRIAGKALFDAEMDDEADELGAALTVALRWANDQSAALRYHAQLRLASLVFEVSERLPEPLQARGLALTDAMIEPLHLPGEETRRLEAALAVIEGRVSRMIAERRASSVPRHDLLSLLLEAHDEGGSRMTDKQVRDEIVTLFIAGHETTATALAWSLYLLARHPEAYARVKAEARSLGGRLPGAADLPALSYSLKVFKEAMRLYPPIYFFGRQSIADVRIGDYDLPRNTVVLISVYALHHRPEIWPDPERFDPERFDPAAEEARHRQAYLPFSAGPRTCIGNHFALMEGPLVLATLLGRVDLELAGAGLIEPELSATLRPRGGVSMRVTAAQDS
jgi:cytochrome P450